MDFTRAIIHGYQAVVLPLETSSNMWFFTDPFTNIVWVLIATSIPIYILAMAGANYLYSESVELGTSSGFVIRNVLSEQNYKIPSQAKAYQKILIIIWLWFTLVLVNGYAGSLTAMLTKPKFETPIKTIEELLKQNEIQWVIQKGTLQEYSFRTSKSGTIMNSLYKRAVIVPRLTPRELAMHGACYTAKTKRAKKLGSFCYTHSIWPIMAKDFSATGKCNFYLIDERLLTTYGVMAFQVS